MPATPASSSRDTSPPRPARRGVSGTTWVVISIVVLGVAGVAYLLKKEEAAKYSEPVSTPRRAERPELESTGIPELDEALRHSQDDMAVREAAVRRAEAAVRAAEQRDKDAQMRLEIERRLKEVIDKNKAAVDAAAMSGTPAPK